MADPSTKPPWPASTIRRYDIVVLETSRECLCRSREILDATEPMVRHLRHAPDL